MHSLFGYLEFISGGYWKNDILFIFIYLFQIKLNILKKKWQIGKLQQVENE